MSYVMYLQLRHIVGTCEQEISFQTWAQRWGMNSGLSYREHGWDVFDKENSERRANGQGELLISRKVYWIPWMAQTVKNLPAMQETWIGSLGQEDTLRKGMATHSSIFAWRIPWTEEPDGLQSMGSQRVGHSWVTKIFTIGSSQVVLMVKNISAHTGNIRDAGLIPGLGRSPGRGHWQPTPGFLPGESHGQKSLVGYSP